MGWSTNEKALAKKEKEEAKKREKAQKKQDEAENRKWKDQESEKVFNNKREKEDKRQQELERKREKKELAEQQEREMDKGKRKKETFAEKKLTHAEIARNMDAIDREAERNELGKQEFMDENPNHALQGHEVAGSVEEALRVLDISEEKHPEKRYKAAFEAFAAKRETELRFEFPKLKRSQRQNMMRKEFEKHPDNPYNKKTVAYNEKNWREKEAEKKEQRGSDSQGEA